MLKDKVIIVTGAGSGIGLATAKLLAEAGAKVVVIGRESDRLATVVDQVRQGGDTPTVVAADVSKEAEVAALVDRAVSEFGRLDGAFNNAGVEMNISWFPT